ncbi:MAG TPA: hypothetical protein VGQ04_21080 [Chitinophagaceae bacterium]|jgi:hypothetical protein|nr:hypothetical protein [Chitinophagaceae bacterium]
MNKQAMKNFLPAIILFLVLNSGFLTMMKRLNDWGFDYKVLVFGNIIVFGISLLSYWMAVKGLTTKNNHAFFRWVYGSVMMKLFILAGVAFVYIMMNKKEVNKPGLFFCMGLYVVYTFIEVSGLMKVNKQKANA